MGRCFVRSLRSTAVTLTALVMASCELTSPEQVDVSFQLLSAIDNPGDTLIARLANHSDRPIGFNLCQTALEQRRGSNWVEIDPLFGVSAGGGCLDILAILSPGGSAQYRPSIPTDLAPGTYRLRTRVEAPLGGSRHELPTGPFSIRSRRAP